MQSDSTKKIKESEKMYQKMWGNGAWFKKGEVQITFILLARKNL